MIKSRFNAKTFEGKVEDANKIMISGPPVMMNNVPKNLEELNVSPSKVCLV